MVDAEELARLLAGTVLGDREVDSIGGNQFAVRCDADEIWPAWQAARSVLDASGRWPVVITSWDHDTPARWPRGEPMPVGQAATWPDVLPSDPWSTFDVQASFSRADEDGPTEWDEVQWDVDDPLPEHEIRALISRGITRGKMERTRFDRRVSTAGGSPAAVAGSRYPTDREAVWFTPQGQPCAVLFLPTAATWMSPRWLAFHGTLGPSRAPALAAIERTWFERYGAELVAAWGTMLQFVVHRRPVSADEAWDLAGEHLLVGGSLQAERSDLAVALTQTDYWFLHDRP